METSPVHWNMKRKIIAIACAGIASIVTAAEPPQKENFMKGADISFLPQMEKLGAVYSDRDRKKDLFVLMKDHGINTVRLRVWHTPENGHCGKKATLDMARRARDSGMRLIIDLHYSDTWADPAHQFKPAAWTNLSFSGLENAVRQYTYETISALVARKTPPDIVQIGNEITGGMLWDDGNIARFNDELHWKQFTRLLKAGIAGVKEASGKKSSTRTMIHIDCGGNNKTSRWFFDNLQKQDVEFDIIGLSFYPWWHGTLRDLGRNINDLAMHYNKDVIVTETAHPWFLFNTDRKKKGEIDSHPGYEASVTGQENYIRDILALVRTVPGRHGMGVVYWAPEWIPLKGSRSTWSELTLFDNQGQVLPSINAFNDFWVP